MTLLDEGRQESSRNASAAVLATPRLRLRAPRAADAKAIASLINDRRIAENTARIPHPYGVADAHAFQAASNRDPAAPSFLITLKDGSLVGGCGIEVFDGRDPELGYWIAVPHWGCGYATEAARAAIDWGWANLDVQQLISIIHPDNLGSMRVAERVGMRRLREQDVLGQRAVIFGIDR